MILNIALPWEDGPIIYWIKHVFIVIGCIYPIVSISLTIIIMYLMVNIEIKYEMLGNQLKVLGTINNRTNENVKLKVSKTEIFLRDLNQ